MRQEIVYPALSVPQFIQRGEQDGLNVGEYGEKEPEKVMRQPPGSRTEKKMDSAGDEEAKKQS